MVRTKDCFFLVAVLVCVGTMADEETRYRSRARHILTGRSRQRESTHPIHSQNNTRNITSSVSSLLSNDSTTSTGLANSAEHEPPRRRGSQSPETLENDDLVNDRQSIVRPENAESSHPVASSSLTRGHVNSSEQVGFPNSQNRQENSQQGGSNGDSPFYSKMSALDYLTRRTNNNIFHNNANTRRNREHGRIMGESMCEAFGKHYVQISIGGKCV